MKPRILFSLCLVLAVLLAGCGKTASSSAGTGASGPVPDASSQQSAVESAAPDTASSGSSGAESTSQSAAPQVDTTEWSKRFVTLPITDEQGNAGKKVLVILRAPEAWEYDNYVTFTQDGTKVAEVLSLRPAASGASPFSDAMMQPYEDNSYYPEGYGLLSTEDTELNGNALRILHMKTWPDDADAPWYPQYAFYELDGYVLEVHFYTDREADADDAALFRAVLGTAELFLGEDEESASAPSQSAAP